MSYQIYRTNGTLLTTVPDGTANTTSTSLTLPGRSYPGYGLVVDTNFVHQLENFSNVSPPPNPIVGQLWYNTANSTLHICPLDGITSEGQWLQIPITSSDGNTTLSNVIVTGNVTVAGTITAALFSGSGANLTNLNAANIVGVVAFANVASVANTVAGANVTGTVANAAYATTSGTADIANAVAGVNVTGTVANAAYAVSAGSAGYSSTAITVTANSQPNINILTSLTTISTGANTTPGTITGTWSLSTGSRLIATYADLAEYYEADEEYEPGTVVEFGGEKEVTLAEDSTNRVAGVISTDPAYIMNGTCSGIAVAIALQGRVPCKVIGNIKKGDMLVSAGGGYAKASTDPKMGTVIGKALQSHSGQGMIEVAIGRL